MTMSPVSWRAKLARAEHHLSDFQIRISRFQDRQVYPVSEWLQSGDDSQVMVRRLRLPELDDPLLPIIVGDLLFNVRSALDHLAMALVPVAKRTRGVVRATQFPIFTCDIDERDPFTGGYLHRRDRGAWDRFTQGITPDALPDLKWCQPYNFHAKNLDPRDSSLAILSTLQNADKHRQLVVFLRGIRDPTSRLTYIDGTIREFTPPPPERGFIGDGTVVDRAPADELPNVQMEVIGTPEIFIGEGGHGPYREWGESLPAIIGNGWTCVDRLEKWVAE